MGTYDIQNIGKKMREVIFRKYWQHMTLPGVVNGEEEDDEHFENGKSTVYNAVMMMLQKA